MSQIRRLDKITHRHTVPNSDYSAFPCYQEEIKLKTNLIGYETNNDFDDDDDDNGSNQEKFEVNVSMHDKLKMCFAEMETVKNQFDTRRRKIQTKKRNASSQNQQPESSSTQNFESKSDPTKSKSKPASDKTTQIRSDIKPTPSKAENDDKFKAHLIRTSSKDSIEDILKEDKDDVSDLPANKETIIVQATIPQHFSRKYPNSKPNVRSVSDPFDNLSFKRDDFELMHSKKDRTIYGDGSFKLEPYDRLQFDWPTSSSDNKAESRKDLGAEEDGEHDDDSGEQRIKNMHTRKSYDQWLQKLDNINDMSKSTINRIKKLENEMSNLKLTTATNSPLSNNAKQYQSKIPVTARSTPTNNPLLATVRNNIFIKKYEDKSTNTDIDLRFMTELLSRWKSKQSSGTQTPDESFAKDTSDNRKIRRLTTVIKRAVDITSTIEKQSSNGDNYTQTASTELTINQNTDDQNKFNLDNKYLENKTQKVSDINPRQTTIYPSLVAQPTSTQGPIFQTSIAPSSLSQTTSSQSTNVQTSIAPPSVPQPTNAQSPISQTSIAPPSVPQPTYTQGPIGQTSIAPPSLAQPTNSLKGPIEQPETLMSILDLPNIETETLGQNYFQSGSNNNFQQMRKSNIDGSINNFQESKSAKTPEPIIEMYSDTDDTSFDNFEKTIYNEISRRAAINNRIVNKKLPDSSKTSIYDELDKLKLRNSATQTNFNSETLPKSVNENNEPPTNQPIKTNLFKKNLQSTSKIVIERTRLNQKDKSEIVLKTNIDKEGKLHRTTEVKNRKYKPKEDRQRSRRQADLIQLNNNHMSNSDYLRKVNSTSNVNIYHTNNQFSRPLSAIDITDDDLMQKRNDDFISNKALSSVDLCSKSPVISEGYHSEYLDSHNRSTPNIEHLIEPPALFQSESDKSEDWEEFAKSEISNKTVNEICEPLTGFDLDNNLLTLTNETLIDNIGKQTNITTTSKTIRKYKPRAKTTSTLDLSDKFNQPEMYGEMDDLMNRNQSVSHCNLNELSPIDNHSDHMEPMFFGKNTVDNYNHLEKQNVGSNQVEQSDHHPNVCNFSLVYNYGNNVIFRANFGIAKLPCLETNL